MRVVAVSGLMASEGCTSGQACDLERVVFFGGQGRSWEGKPAKVTVETVCLVVGAWHECTAGGTVIRLRGAWAVATFVDCGAPAGEVVACCCCI